jgi:hypothetical protein
MLDYKAIIPLGAYITTPMGHRYELRFTPCEHCGGRKEWYNTEEGGIPYINVEQLQHTIYKDGQNTVTFCPITHIRVYKAIEKAPTNKAGATD